MRNWARAKIPTERQPALDALLKGEGHPVERVPDLHPECLLAKCPSHPGPEVDVVAGRQREPEEGAEDHRDPVRARIDADTEHGVRIRHRGDARRRAEDGPDDEGQDQARDPYQDRIDDEGDDPVGNVREEQSGVTGNRCGRSEEAQPGVDGGAADGGAADGGGASGVGLPPGSGPDIATSLLSGSPPCTHRRPIRLVQDTRPTQAPDGHPASGPGRSRGLEAIDGSPRRWDRRRSRRSRTVRTDTRQAGGADR